MLLLDSVSVVNFKLGWNNSCVIDYISTTNFRLFSLFTIPTTSNKLTVVNELTLIHKVRRHSYKLHIVEGF